MMSFARLTLVAVIAALVLLPARSAVRAVAMAAPAPRVVGLETPVDVGSVNVWIESVFTSTCAAGGHGIRVFARPGWEFLYVNWSLQALGAGSIPLPHSNRPGFRLVGAQHLFPGAHAGGTAYSPVVPADGSTQLLWRFAIRAGTRRVFVTYLPPGPHHVLWSIAVPARPRGSCW